MILLKLLVTSNNSLSPKTHKKIKRLAVLFLANFQSPQAVSILKRKLKDADNQVRVNALLALMEMDHLPQVKSYIYSLNSSDIIKTHSPRYNQANFLLLPYYAAHSSDPKAVNAFKGVLKYFEKVSRSNIGFNPYMAGLGFYTFSLSLEILQKKGNVELFKQILKTLDDSKDKWIPQSATDPRHILDRFSLGTSGS